MLFAEVVAISVSAISLTVAREPAPLIQFSVPDLVYSIDVSQDGRLVAAGSRGNGSETLSLFDIEKDQKRWTADAGNYVWDLAFSPDGKILAVCSEGGTKIFSIDQTDGQVVLTGLAALQGGLDVDISANGKWIASGGYAGKVLICNSRKGDPIGTIEVAGQRDSIFGVKFCAEDSKIVVGGMLGRGPERSGFVQIWDIAELTGRPALP